MPGIRINGRRFDITCTPEDCYLCSHLSICRLGVSTLCTDSCIIRKM
ncbi:MAG: hypothetical protein QXN71_02015 [Candidatus Aenigmatarchaeota archaeon]